MIISIFLSYKNTKVRNSNMEDNMYHNIKHFGYTFIFVNIFHDIGKVALNKKINPLASLGYISILFALDKIR